MEYLGMFPLLFLVISILFIQTFTISTFGFGGAILGMVLLSNFIDIQSAAPLVSLTAGFTSLTIIMTSWRMIDLRSVWRLVLSALIGIPFGVYAIKNIPEALIKLPLGIIVILFSVYNLWQPRMMELKGNYWAFPFGFLGGVLGGGYSMAGPPMIIFSVLQRWSPEQHRATMHSYFLPVTIGVSIFHGLGGLWTPFVIKCFLWAIIPTIVAIVLGARINRKINPQNFKKMIYGLLMILGGLLLF